VFACLLAQYNYTYKEIITLNLLSLFPYPVYLFDQLIGHFLPFFFLWEGVWAFGPPASPGLAKDQTF